MKTIKRYYNFAEMSPWITITVILILDIMTSISLLFNRQLQNYNFLSALIGIAIGIIICLLILLGMIIIGWFKWQLIIPGKTKKDLITYFPDHLDSWYTIIEYKQLLNKSEWLTLTNYEKNKLSNIYYSKVKNILELPESERHRLLSRFSHEIIRNINYFSDKDYSYNEGSKGLHYKELLLINDEQIPNVEKWASYTKKERDTLSQLLDVEKVKAFVNNLNHYDEDAISITELQNNGVLQIDEIKGGGIYNLFIKFSVTGKVNTKYSYIYIPFAISFIPNGIHQTMTSRQSVKLAIKSGSTFEANIPVVCIEHSKKVPDSFCHFNSFKSVNNPEVKKVLAIAQFANVSEFVIQLATWLITDNIDLDQIKLYQSSTMFDFNPEVIQPSPAEKEIIKNIADLVNRI